MTNREKSINLEDIEKLKAHIEEQEELLHATRDIVFRITGEGYFDYASPSVRDVLGRSPEEWTKHFSEYITDHPLNQKAAEIWEKSRKEKKSFPPYLTEIFHADGRRIMLEIHETPIFKEGEFAYWIGTARDVTERFKMQETLRKRNEQMHSELALAARVHGTLIPKSFQNDKVSIVLSYLPMSVMGGDYANYFFREDGRLAFIISDVTGHGIPAALLVNRLDTEWKRLAGASLGPGRLLHDLNQFIDTHFSGTRMYLTAFCGFLDFSSQKLSYSNYGHPPQYLYRVTKSDIMSLESHTMMLGVPFHKKEMLYEDQTNVEKDDRILLFTDGVTETANVGQEFYGEERIQSFVRKNNQLDDHDFNAKLIDELTAFKAGPFTDDIFVVNIKIKK